MKSNNSVRPDGGIAHPKLAGLLDVARKFLGGDRFRNLLSVVSAEIQAINLPAPRLLDYGCGSMVFAKSLQASGTIDSYLGVDIFPQLAGMENYRQITGSDLGGIGRFDLAIVLDVLHHIPEAEQPGILHAIGQRCGTIIVKDHFEHSRLSRLQLQLADVFGNYAYGVPIPRRYFTRARWQQTIKAAGLREVRRQEAVRIHKGLFGILLPSKCHFLAVLAADHARA